MANAKESSPARISAVPNPVRPPNPRELAQLWEWLKRQGHDESYGLDESTWFKAFWIAVFDNYITGCTGYCGKVLYLVWDCSPDFCDIFTWHDEELVHVSTLGDCPNEPFSPVTHRNMAATDRPTSENKTVSCFQCTRPEIENNGRCRFCNLAEPALEAFWEVIVQHFPHAKYGDLSPERTIHLCDAAATAIEEWISNNVLPQDGE